MMHELKHIVYAYKNAKKSKNNAVLATVVDLDGSSYRKPGVRMLILENGEMIGAVSGGCVEKEVLRQSRSVFNDGIPKIMSYDGRYRLGCEGVIYILIESFNPDNSFIKSFEENLFRRGSLEIKSYYSKKEESNPNFGTLIKIDNIEFAISGLNFSENKLNQFKQIIPPCFKLFVFGSEHDAVSLCKQATLVGWEVEVIASASETKTIENFPGANQFISTSPESFSTDRIDTYSAVMIMTHSFAQDLKWLIALREIKPTYLGLLGPVKKRENLISNLLDYIPDLSEEFINSIHGPAGLDIGSVTAQEIAISIISEILSVKNKRTPTSLKEKTGTIHA